MTVVEPFLRCTNTEKAKIGHLKCMCALNVLILVNTVLNKARSVLNTLTADYYLSIGNNSCI